MRTKLNSLMTVLFVLTLPVSSIAFADENAGAQTIRPVGYKPIAGDVKLGKKLFNDTKLSTNGMSCATCHANHAAYSASFAQPYPHVVAMAKNQLGRQTVHLDEMIQACMLMPMAAHPLPWDSQELAALVAYVQLQQKTFKAAR